MNILFINDCGVEGSGTEVRLKLLLQSLARHTNYKLYLLEHETSHSTISGVRIYRASSQDCYSITRKIIKEHHIDIVQIHNATTFNAEPFNAAHSIKKPIIFSAHDYWGFCGRRDLLFNKRICKGPNLTHCTNCVGFFSWIHTKKIIHRINCASIGIAPSNFVADRYQQEGILKNKWRVILPWIDLTTFHPKRSSRTNTLLFIGSLAYYKGAHNIIETLRYLPSSIRLFFVGGHHETTNPDRLRLEKLARTYNVLDRILFLGQKNHSELNQLYQKARAVIFAPVWPEPSALTLQEAMASGCPIVATRTGGLPEFLENKGTLVEPNNTIELAQAIQNIISNPKQTNRLAQNAERYARKHFTPAAALKHFTALYQELVPY